MANAVISALKALKDALSRVGIKEPWKVTGVRSLPDYEHYLPKGLEYRKFSPGTQPVKAKVPHDSPKLVYDIKYFVRDYRRNNKYSAKAVEATKPFDFEKVFGTAPVKPEDIKRVPRPAVMPTRGF